MAHLKLKSMSDTDRGYYALVRQLLEDAPNASFTVGIHDDEAGHEVYEPEQGKASGITMSELGEIHEFGLGVPQRSFIGDWFDETQDQKVKQIKGVALAFLKGKISHLSVGFEQLGNLYVGQVQKRMADGIDPPLSEITIAKKGSSVPLIDTGQLRSSITYKVSEK